MSFLLARLNHACRTFLRTPTDFDRRQFRAATHRELFDEIPDGPGDSKFDYAEQCSLGHCVCGQVERNAARLNEFEEENECHEPWQSVTISDAVMAELCRHEVNVRGRVIESPTSSDSDPCQCFWTPESTWTTHYGAVEPGSQREWNPDCPMHPPTCGHVPELVIPLNSIGTECCGHICARDVGHPLDDLGYRPHVCLCGALWADIPKTPAPSPPTGAGNPGRQTPASAPRDDETGARCSSPTPPPASLTDQLQADERRSREYADRVRPERLVEDVLIAHRFAWVNHSSIGANSHCGCGYRPMDLSDWEEHAAPIIAAVFNPK